MATDDLRMEEDDDGDGRKESLRGGECRSL